jgi:DNA-binding CsgD family transcriptional regulator
VSAIVGREVELAAIERFLDTLAVGPASVLIEGEAGIGKTTLWAESVRLAAARGFSVLEARPVESERNLSYAGLADLVEGVFEETRSVLPDVQERALAVALLREDSDAVVSSRATGTALIGVLAALAGKRLLLVAVDDVQWLDPASAEALSFAARRLPGGVGLLLSRRVESDEVLPLGLAGALPVDRCERIGPGPLSLAALHHLIVSRLGFALPRPLLVRVAAVSGGNPFFALEIARGLARQSREHTIDAPLPIPPSLDGVVAARLGTLSDAARRAALAAAALSRPTATTVVAALAEVGDAHAALLEAEEAGVLIDERGRLRFAHPLLASAIYASASSGRRRLLHERLAAIVGDSEERARHLALSTIEANEAIARDIEQAASQAARRGAPQAAAELFAASRRLTPTECNEELARRALGEARSVLAAGDAGGARKLAEDVATSSIGSMRAQALFLLGEVAWISGSSSASEHFEAALETAPRDGALAARIYPRLVTYTTPHDPARSVEHAEAAMKLLIPERDPAALAHVTFERLWAGVLLGRGEERGLVERWQQLEAKAGSEAQVNPAALIRFWCLDDFDAVRARHALEDTWYRERGEELWQAERLAHLGYAELRAGLVEVAERYVEDACEALAQQLETPGPWASAFRFRSFVDAHRGRTDRARVTLVRLINEAERTGRAFWEALGLSTLAFVEAVEGDHEAVDRALTRMRARLDSIGIEELPPDRSEPFHVESLLALGELDRARRELERLERRGRVLPRLWISVTLPRARALVLAAEGDTDAALEALDELDCTAASRLPFDLAWAELVRGRLHRRVKQKRAATDALRRALAIFERLGAPVFVERTTSELARVRSRRAPDDLTATERRVAELAAAGLTNREVASAAFMSPKTVQANLTRVYRKLGIRSRAELGAHMAKEAAAEPKT